IVEVPDRAPVEEALAGRVELVGEELPRIESFEERAMLRYEAGIGNAIAVEVDVHLDGEIRSVLEPLLQRDADFHHLERIVDTGSRGAEAGLVERVTRLHILTAVIRATLCHPREPFGDTERRSDVDDTMGFARLDRVDAQVRGGIDHRDVTDAQLVLAV